MTHTQLKQHCDRIESAILALTDERTAIFREYIKNLPYKEGDKVRVTRYTNGNGEIQTVCYIGKIKIGYKDVEIVFHKARKDGTMSGQSAGIYWHNKIEVIKSAKRL